MGCAGPELSGPALEWDAKLDIAIAIASCRSRSKPIWTNAAPKSSGNFRVIEVADNIDQWQAAEYRYVKVRDSDGNVYILRHNEIRAEWELTMYQRSQPQGAPANPRF